MQEYACSVYYKIERERLRYLETHQEDIKADSRKNIIDALDSTEDNSVKNVGQRVVLPATHIGSPRWYQKRFNDAMSVVREFGKPDLFITFTAHGKWKEVLDSLHDNGETEDTIGKKILCTLKIWNSNH